MKRKQTARDPVDLSAWTDLTLARGEAVGFTEFFNLTTEPTGIAGMGFEELCDAVSGQENGEADEWAEWYEDTFGEALLRRWNKAQVIQALAAEYFKGKH